MDCYTITSLAVSILSLIIAIASMIVARATHRIAEKSFDSHIEENRKNKTDTINNLKTIFQWWEDLLNKLQKSPEIAYSTHKQYGEQNKTHINGLPHSTRGRIEEAINREKTLTYPHLQYSDKSENAIREIQKVIKAEIVTIERDLINSGKRKPGKNRV